MTGAGIGEGDGPDATTICCATARGGAANPDEAQGQMQSCDLSGVVGAGDDGSPASIGPGLSMLHIDIVIVVPFIDGMKP